MELNNAAEETLAAAIASVAAAPDQLSDALARRPEPLIAFDGARQIVAANAAAEQFFGYERHQLDAQPVEVLVPPRLRQPNAPPPLVTSDITTVELPGLRKDGVEIPTVWIFSSVVVRTGPVFVMTVLDRDQARMMRMAADVYADLQRERESSRRTASSSGSYPQQGAIESVESLIARLDWAASPLGSPDRWPHSLRTVLRLMLSSRYAMWMGWGRDLTFFCNDTYRDQTLGKKYPWAIGRPAREVWAEIWDVLEPRIEHVLATGEATYDEGLQLFLERSGYSEETYHSFSYSAAPGDAAGEHGGLFCVVVEETERVIGERRIAFLGRLAAELSGVKSSGDVFAALQKCLAADPRDVPFSLVYLVDEDTKRASRISATGFFGAHPSAPDSISLEDEHAPWPVAAVLERNGPIVVDLDSAQPWPVGPWKRMPSRALVLPIASAIAGSRPVGVLVAGLNPHRPYDDKMRELLALLTGQLAAGLSSAGAYESERKRAEALAEIDRAKTRFFSNVSHEFRTPLTLMLGPVEDALATSDKALAGENLHTVYRNARRLLKLVNSLLDFARIEAGRAKASYRPTDLAALTSDLASSFRSAVERAGLVYEVDCPPLPESIFVDHDMWEKIVLNLISNALKFTFDGRIRVALRSTAEGAELVVSDTGTGIPEREIGRLFERFHRVQGARARTHEGSGIGLALVNELVRLHGGTIRVESREGAGTTFHVVIARGRDHLPAERVENENDADTRALGAAPFVEEALRWLPGAPAQSAGAREHIEGTLGPEAFPRGVDGHILLADDNADMRDYVARLLRQRWSVETVADGAEALAAAKRRVPDLVLTDVMMPGLDGFGLLVALRKHLLTRSVPVIMLSARAGEESRVEGLQAGADDYLVKPFSARELVARVATHLQIAAHRKREAALRAAAEQASRAKDEFLSVLSHELRTPLNAIIGWSSMLRDGSIQGAQLTKAHEIIERNARVQARLIEDLLELSRIEQGKLVLSVGPLEMVRVVEAAIDAVSPAAEAKGVRLQRVLDSHATIVGDADRLQQVVWNLLMNAIKFTPRGGRVQVQLHRAHSHVELVVSDTGQGIDGDFLPHVFDRFRQADPSHSRKAGGLGLGLAIVRSIVELHGGTVAASSDGREKGATFSVRLPTAPLRADGGDARLSQPDVPKSAVFDCPPEVKGLSVLVVDDEPETRSLLEYVMRECSAHVTAAASAQEAFDLIKNQNFDVMVSDVGMPGEDGHSLMRRVRSLPGERGRKMPAIALTAYARSEDRAEAFRAGFDMHLAKPIEPRELVLVIGRLVSRKVDMASS